MTSVRATASAVLGLPSSAAISPNRSPAAACRKASSRPSGLTTARRTLPSTTRNRRNPGSPRANTISPLRNRASRKAAAQASRSSAPSAPKRLVCASNGTMLTFPAMAASVNQPSQHAVEGDADTRRPPVRDRARRRAGTDNVGPLPGLQDHAAAGSRHGDPAAFDEYTENAVAGAGEEAGAAHGDQAEWAANLHRCRRRALGTVEQQWPRFQRQLAASVHQIAVDGHPCARAEAHLGLAAELDDETRGLPGSHPIGDEDRGLALEDTARAA